MTFIMMVQRHHQPRHARWSVCQCALVKASQLEMPHGPFTAPSGQRERSRGNGASRRVQSILFVR